MAKSLEDIKTSFENADQNKDGLLNDVDLNAAIALLGLVVKKEEADIFAKTAGRSRSGLINRDEFELLVRFYESPIKAGNAILLFLAESLNQFGQILNLGNAFYCQESHVKVHVSDQDSKHAKFPSAFTVLGGDTNSNHHLAKIITDSHPSSLAVVFNIGVKNNSQILDSINEKLNSLKDVISEISTECKEVLKVIDIVAVPTKNGIQIVIDFSKHSVFETYSRIVAKNMEYFEKHPLPFYLNLQTTVDFDNLETPFAKVVEEVFSVDFESQNFSFSHLLNHSDYKQLLKAMIDSKNSFSAFLTLLASIKTINFILNLDHKMRANLSSQVKEMNDNATPKDLVETLVTLIENAGGYEFIEMFDDAREILRILKKNEATHAGIFLKLHNEYIGVDMKASAYNTLNKILKLE